MNRQQAKELLPIVQAVQAFIEGKPLQQQLLRNEWIDVQTNSDIYINNGIYRIKPNETYRPFKSREECWEEMQKHQPIGWVNSGKLLFNIITIRTDGIIIHNGVDNSWYAFESAIKLNFVDGTPFGIKE